MDANVNHVIFRLGIATAAGLIGSLLYVLLSTEDPLKLSVRKFLVGVLASSVFTGIACRYANMDSTQMDVWIAGAASVGFGGWTILTVVLKKMSAWANAWSGSSVLIPQVPTAQTPAPPAAGVPAPPPATLTPSVPAQPPEIKK